MLSENKINKLRKEIDESINPLFFYDDDPDGLCSYLLLKRYKKEGHGVFVKALPELNHNFISQVRKYSPDKVFVLDIPKISEDFFDNVKSPLIWVDHHKHDFQPQRVKSFNTHDENVDETNTSTTQICYQVTKQNLWIATIGAISDWTIPYYLDDFKKMYGDLLPNQNYSAPEMMFNSPLTDLITMFSFILKGDNNKSKRAIKSLLKIESPYELIEGKSEAAKEIFKKIEPIKKEYDKLLNEASNIKSEGEIIVFIYQEDKNSFTKEISNYLQYKNPNKTIIVGRKRDDEYRISLRSQSYSIPEILNKALTGLEGNGGGHEHACGASIKEHHFEEFINRLKLLFKESK